MDLEDARQKLTRLLALNSALSHLHVRKHGASLLLLSGHPPDEQKHVRFTHLSGATWGLSFPLHTGRWEKTPFTGSLAELLALLVTDFAFYLQPS